MRLATPEQGGVNEVPPGPLDDSISICRRFQTQRQLDTEPELALRRKLLWRGVCSRWRTEAPSRVRGAEPTWLFVPSQVAVFADGCFGHGCPQHGTDPRNNTDWWREKPTVNVEGDCRVDVRRVVRA